MSSDARDICCRRYKLKLQVFNPSRPWKFATVVMEWDTAAVELVAWNAAVFCQVSVTNRGVLCAP